MVAVNSTMLALGTIAPSFTLNDVRNGEKVTLNDENGAKGYLVVFLCNHCPYVKLILDDLVKFCKQAQKNGIRVVMISSNDVDKYPEDSPEKMAFLAEEKGFTFPYLYDETQAVAKAYKAACTPDFYLFDKTKKLVYRGQFDGARPGNNIKPSGETLAWAMHEMLEGRDIPAGRQIASLGCNIKWKAGNEPEYFSYKS